MQNTVAKYCDIRTLEVKVDLNDTSWSRKKIKLILPEED